MKRKLLARRTPLKAKTPLRARAPMRTRSRPKATPERLAARGMPCLLNVAGVCVYDSARVALVHFRWLGECGTALKPSDLQGAPGCDACNRWTDSPTPREVENCGGRVAYERDRNFYALRALVRLRIYERQEAA